MAMSKLLESLSLDDKYVMVAAIDFGTTYSGYAFSFKTNPTSVIMNKNWGESLGCQSYKTPTCVLTGPEGEFVAFGHEAEERYGQLVEDDDCEEHCLFRQFKMILHRKENLSLKSSISSTNGTIRKALDIFAMSLEYLKGHLIGTLKKQLEREPDVKMIRWVLTVPAIWSEEAKQFMREAAFRAGMIDSKDSKKLIIALEPEAASIQCRSLKIDQFVDLDKSKSLSFQTGRRYIVVDAGGGTVDVTAHEILSNGSVKELHLANGGALGGIKIDQNFVNLIKKVLGADFIDIFKKELPQQWFLLLSTFDKVKKSFKPDGKCKLNISLGYALGTRFHEVKGVSIDKVINGKQEMGVSFKNGALIINHETASQLYKPVVKGIIDHIRAQLSLPALRSVSYLMLVGGFGECTYLQETIKQELGRGVTLLIPNEAQLAVIKGAVLFGHNPTVISSRISRKTYGLSLMQKYKEGRHDVKRVETIHGQKWVKDIFQPFVKKGELIETGRVKKERRVPHKPDQKCMNIRIYSLDREKMDEVEYLDAPDLVQLGKVIVKMPNIEQGLKRAVNIEIVLGGTEIQVSATDETSGTTTEAAIDFLTE